MRFAAPFGADHVVNFMIGAGCGTEVGAPDVDGG
jgi:hypothetical protein